MTRTPVADWQQLSALYELADALEPVPLEAMLAQLRAKAHPLLPQLMQMLEARVQVQDQDFLGTLPRLPEPPGSYAPLSARSNAATGSTDPAVPKADEWVEGSRVGPYRLLRHIGAGGMAEVWLAERDDGAFQRTVAIKLLFRHAGSSQRDSFAQRFSRERDILASLHHPHIAGLHDAGVTASGQPWLALEYVEGETLTKWCDSKKLGIEARVRLFRQVLLAVQYAHSNLIIHRDLKPGNILVTQQGEVRLLDFGIAKLMEPEGGPLAETELTRQAGRPLTVQYASPEQLTGQPLTTACDVYSLGVVLYELLCGERPYELKLKTAASMEQAILEAEPRAPSRRVMSTAAANARGITGEGLRKSWATDLDAIVLRALAKEPARRYTSVEALRNDLDRWLGGEPVEARAPSAAYRLAKFAGRHRLAVALGSGAVLSLIAVATVAVVMGLQAREESARAVAARDFMLNIFQRADQEKSRGADITARDMLETGRKDVLTRLAGQPSLQAELLHGIAKIQGDMGEFVTADSTFAELVRVRSELHEPREEAMARADRAFNALQMNNPVLAQRLIESARAVTDRPARDAELNARISEVEGVVLRSQGDAQQARVVLQAARDAATRDLGAAHLRTFKLGQALYGAQSDLTQFDAALALHEDLRKIAPRVQGLDPSEAQAMDWEHVVLLISAGRLAQALSLIDVALPRCIETVGPEGQDCRMLFADRAHVLLGLGRADEALESLPRLHAMTLDATLPFLQIRSLLIELRLRALTTSAAGATDLVPLFERVRLFGQSGSANPMKPTFKADALLALSEARLRVGDAEQARQWADKAIETLGDFARQGPGLRLAALGRMLTGISLLKQDRPEQALSWLRRAQSDYAKALGPEHLSTQLAALNTAMALGALDRNDDAAEMVKRAQPSLREALGADAPNYKAVVELLNRLENPPAAHLQKGLDTALPARSFFR